MKLSKAMSAVLFFTAIPALASAGFPFPSGKYVGKSVCKDESGQSFSNKVTLNILDKSIETIYEGSVGEIRDIKNAVFDSSGFFTLNGPDVVQGQGYCLARMFCHYDATLRVQGEELAGEDSLFIKDKILYRMGSVLVNGMRVSCEESFPQFSKQP